MLADDLECFFDGYCFIVGAIEDIDDVLVACIFVCLVDVLVGVFLGSVPGPLGVVVVYVQGSRYGLWFLDFVVLCDCW